ncbi:MAG TPA: HAD-IIIA family hydrolase [Thermodesulfovibrionales bacterium]|jgi:3-deoxy-D-manno-octulosonate 8-phosphate phosphatase (KDO 8-P phosphatase)|nr:HAD-IIIA family hydrolase [Thermodesulfovibrionales bacterium]
MEEKQRSLKEIAKNIKLLILDVDGVLTDGSIILDNDNNELKRFHVRDGHGIKMLVGAGMRVAIITGRYSQVVERRARELGITDIYQRCLVKTVAFDDLIEKLKVSSEEVAYVGDDVVDIPIFRRVGLPIAVSDAAEEAKDYALMITRNPGGRGAVREVCDLLLRSTGRWESIIGEYLEA